MKPLYVASHVRDDLPGSNNVCNPTLIVQCSECQTEYNVCKFSALKVCYYVCVEEKTLQRKLGKYLKERKEFNMNLMSCCDTGPIF